MCKPFLQIPTIRIQRAWRTYRARQLDRMCGKRQSIRGRKLGGISIGCSVFGTDAPIQGLPPTATHPEHVTGWGNRDTLGLERCAPLFGGNESLPSANVRAQPHTPNSDQVAKRKTDTPICLWGANCKAAHCEKQHPLALPKIPPLLPLPKWPNKVNVRHNDRE